MRITATNICRKPFYSDDNENTQKKTFSQEKPNPNPINLQLHQLQEMGQVWRNTMRRPAMAE